MISRATTAGKKTNGKRLNSAFYFYDHGFGKVMTPARITNLRSSPSTKQLYLAIRKRDKWVAHLMTNRTNSKYPQYAIDNIFHWAQSTRILSSDLHRLIHDTPSWRKQHN